MAGGGCALASPPKANGKGGGRRKEEGGRKGRGGKWGVNAGKGRGLGGRGAWVRSIQHPLPWLPKVMLKLDHFSISFGDFSFFFVKFFRTSN
jgi:hypothetical protein